MKTRLLTVSYIHVKDKKVPLIRITGKWLAETGFNVGDKITVSVAPEELVITKEGKDDIERTVSCIPKDPKERQN